MPKQINVSLYLIDLFIPLVQDKTISLTDSLILSYIWQFSVRGKPCYARNKSIADKIGVSPRTVETNIQKLISKGFLQRIDAENLTQREMFLIWEKFGIDPEVDLDYFKYKYVDKGNKKKEKQTDTTMWKDEAYEDPPPRAKKTKSKKKTNETDDNWNSLQSNLKSSDSATEGDVASSVAYDSLAKTLHDSLPHRLKSARKFKVSTWSEHFRKLHQLDGVPLDTIWSVLKWYVRVQTDPYVPTATTAETFRSKFDNLFLAYERNKNKEPSKQEITKKKVGKQARRVVTRLQKICNLDKSELAPIVQEALDNFEKLKEEIPDHEKAIDYTWKGGTDFAYSWFRHWIDRYSDWSEWSGDASTLRCKWKSDKFCEWVDQNLKLYTSRRVRWKR